MDRLRRKFNKNDALKAQPSNGGRRDEHSANLHSSLISVPKMAEHGYIAVFNKKEARIYDGTTTTITASGEPIIVAPRCNDTGLWKMNLDLDYKILGCMSSDQFIAGVDVANAIFDLPNSRQSLMYFHAAAGDGRTMARRSSRRRPARAPPARRTAAPSGGWWGMRRPTCTPSG